MSKKFKLIEWAKDFAPKALGQTFDLVGDLTGVRAFNALSDVISKDNPDALTPDQIAKVAELKQLDLKDLELRMADMANARSREVELAKAGKMDWMMKVVGICVLSLLFLVVIAVLFFELKNENLAHLIVGEILGLASGMVFYYYGTSKSSADKSEHISKILNPLK